jgi:hypothetical protein
VKTISLKKVAVVAVASLAIGTFTAIAPANAVVTGITISDKASTAVSAAIARDIAWATTAGVTTLTFTAGDLVVADIGKHGVVIVCPPWVDRLNTTNIVNSTSWFATFDLVKAIYPKAKIKIIGKRPGEKIDEQLITEAESLNAYDLGKYYVILGTNDKLLKRFYKIKAINKISRNFTYTSKNNKNFLSVNELKKVIKKFLNK